MARYAKSHDLIDQVRHLQEQVRRLQTRSRQITSHTKTFLIGGGPIPAGAQTPPFIISSTPRFSDDELIEEAYPQDIRIVTGVTGKLLDGTATIDFYVNSDVVYGGLDIDATPKAHWTPIRRQLQDGDMLSITIVTADDLCRDLSASFMMTLEVWP